MDTPHHGLLVIDKPSRITSRDAVDRVQNWFPRRTRVGHTGTLDPLATGVLVVCVGIATRLTEYVQLMRKVYAATITLGATSDTDDADGSISPLPSGAGPSRDEIARALTSFIGSITQVPPAYSAAKVTGRRAYALARKGQTVTLEPRQVTIEGIDIVRYEYPQLEIVVRCSKGTYIRSLARDLGQQLGCGGYIAALRRLEVGGFTVDLAISLDADAATARTHLLPAWRALQDHAPIILPDTEAAKLLQGKRIAVPSEARELRGDIVVVNNAGGMLAVTALVEGWLQPRKVLVCG